MEIMGSTPSSVKASFICKDEVIENFRPMKVRVIGAGYSGIYLGVRIPQRLKNVDFQIYEKNEGVGGTWWENRYGISPTRTVLLLWLSYVNTKITTGIQVALVTFQVHSTHFGKQIHTS